MSNRSAFDFFGFALPLLLLVALGLSACGGKAAGPAFSCPRTGMVQDADRLYILDEAQASGREAIQVAAEIEGFEYACRPVPARGTVDYRLTVSFVAQRLAPGMEMKALTLPYFVAILDGEGEVVSRRAEETRLIFGEQVGTLAGKARRGFFGLGGRETAPIAADVARVDAQHVFDIALPDPGEAGRYHVAIGFGLTPAQLAFNQSMNKPAERAKQ